MTTLYTIILSILCYHLLLLWIANHKELTAKFTGNIHRIWARATRNFGEKEEQPYVDTHAPHVILKDKK